MDEHPVQSNVEPFSHGREDSNLASADPEFEMEGQVVLILCGLVASGKSTFAESLQSHFPQFRRCNQDDLGDRRRVEQLARQSLSQGLSVCIDRTNFNASQRFHWIKIARESPGTSIWVIVFDTPYEVCAARLQDRTGHPTITSPEQGLSVLSRFAKDFELPEPNEGYDRILFLRPEDHPFAEYSRSDMSIILRRVRDSETVLAPADFTAALPSRGRHHNNGRGGNNFARGRGNQFRPRGGWMTGQATSNHNNNGIGRPGIAPGMSTAFRGWRSPPFRGSDDQSWFNAGRGRRIAWGSVSQDSGVSRAAASGQRITGGDGSSRDPFTID